ncbi:MAG TPA: D-glycero-beta-D-manno-heptose 1-phosphate adenylyltransferase [Micromonosporaceae bacterium]|nr:D-glycero-beta-D-manno-heptose 1-phosphate adenylyltransferase [Micromonosporaceae bacterium]
MPKEDLAAAITSWAGRDVLVLGDAMLDEWRFAESDRLCREAPAPVLTLRRRQTAAGGAANTAVNLAALGARPILVAPVGADAAGDELRDCLDRAGVRDRTVTRPGVRTPVKRRILAADQILVREDEGGDGGRPTDRMIDDLLAALDAAIGELGRDPQRPTLVVCDYGLGALPTRVRDWLVARRQLFGTVALDAHDLAAWADLRPTVVTPSYAESTRLLGMAATSDGDRAANALAHLGDLRMRTGAEVVAVTLDVDGAIVAGPDGNVCRSHTTPVAASHAVGAGDAYLAAMTLALAVDAPVPVAAELAQLAATATLANTGTCVCRRRDLLAAIGRPRADVGQPDPSAAVLDDDALVAVVARHRAEGRRIVFTNGCFDVLHRGHVRYLEQARELGDLLIVAVNSDDSVQRLKGPDRPVNPVEDRVAVLAALSCIDHVVVFEEDSPAHLIAAVRPDTYVKGGDYPPEMVPEAPLVRRLGGEVRTLGYVPDRSTSAIIDKIRAQGEERATHKGLTGDPA